MEFMISGKPEAPAVLFLPASGSDAAALAATLKPLEKNYRVVLPSSPMDTPSLEKALLWFGLEMLWGAWGLREGATELLALLSRGNVRVRTAVLEGAFALPEKSLRDYEGTLICWKGGKDRKAKKSWEALKKEVPGLRSLTLGKLKKDQDFLSVRPDLMVRRLNDALGSARVIRLEQILPWDVDRVWQRVRRQPMGRAELRLEERGPLVWSDADFTRRLEGRSRKISLWRHTVRLSPLGDNCTACTDQLEIAAGKRAPLAAMAARRYLRREQARREALLKREK